MRNIYRTSLFEKVFVVVLTIIVLVLPAIYEICSDGVGYFTLIAVLIFLVKILDTFIYVVTIDENGLEVKSFNIGKRFVPWDEVIAVRSRGRMIQVVTKRDRPFNLSVGDMKGCIGEIMHYAPDVKIDDYIQERILHIKKPRI